MKIFFIDCKQDIKKLYPHHIFAPLDIGYCTSLLEKEGNSVDFLDLRIKNHSFEGIIGILKLERPDILLIKPGEHSVKLANDIAKIAKDFVDYIFCYGPFATVHTGFFIDEKKNFDICLLEEIEYTLLDAVKSIKNNEDIKQTNGIAYYDGEIIRNPGNYVMELDKLPFPRQDTFFDKGYTFFYPLRTRKRIKPGFVLTSRGCPYRCSYCSILSTASFGKIYRKRSPENVVEEVEYMINMGYNAIYFIDDNIGVDRGRLYKMCRLISERNLNKKFVWMAQLRADNLDEELIIEMKKAGCGSIGLGLESGSQKILNDISKTMKRQTVVKNLQLLKKNKIWIAAYFIIGNPNETKEDIKESMKLCREIMPEMLTLSIFKVYKDTPSYKQFKIEDYLTIKEFNPENNISNLTDKELKKFHMLFYLKYYLSPKYLTLMLPKIMMYYLININFSYKFAFKSLRFFSAKLKDLKDSNNKTIFVPYILKQEESMVFDKIAEKEMK